MGILHIIGGAVSILGALFLLLASIGLIRMPDVYNRMQTGTKATTFGTIMFLGGIGIATPSMATKLIILVLFIVLTNPVSSHVLARAAHFAGVPLADRSVTDKLAEHRAKEGVQ